MRIRALVAAAALAAAASGCGSSDERAATELETLRVGVVNAIDALPLYVMADKGFAGREGLRLVETDVEGGTASLALMARGEQDVGNVSVVALASGAQEGLVPDEAVAISSLSFADPEAPMAALFARDDVRSLADLAGERIAVNTPTSLGGVAMREILRTERIRGAALFEIPFANMGLAVRGGDVAAAVMFEPFIAQSLERGDGHILGWVIGGPPMERVLASLMAASGDLLRERPETVARFLRAQVAALDWIAADEAGAREVLARRLSISPEVVAKVVMPRFDPQARIDTARMEPMLDVTDRVLGTESVAPRRLFDPEPLASALRK